MVKVSLSSHAGKNSKSSGLRSLGISGLSVHPGLRTRLSGTKRPRTGTPEEGTTVRTISQKAAKPSETWQTDPRWKDTERTYTAKDVVRPPSTIQAVYTPARHGT